MPDDLARRLLSEKLRVDPKRWSDALQRSIEIPASALWPVACLAYEVDSRIDHDARTPELEAWLWRVQQVVAEIVGVGTWDDAVKILDIPARSQSSLAAWVRGGAAPPSIASRLQVDRQAGPEDTGRLRQADKSTQATDIDPPPREDFE